MQIIGFYKKKSYLGLLESGNGWVFKAFVFLNNIGYSKIAKIVWYNVALQMIVWRFYFIDFIDCRVKGSFVVAIYILACLVRIQKRFCKIWSTFPKNP